MNLFQENHAANLARHEATNARLEALTQDFVNSKVDSDPIKHISQNRGWKGKNRVAGGSGYKTRFPRFNGQEDPLEWLKRCEDTNKLWKKKRSDLLLFIWRAMHNLGFFN